MFHVKHSRSHGLGAEYQEQAEPGQIYSGVLDPMLRGYRGIVAALGLVLAAHHPNAEAQPKQSNPQERSASALENIASRYNEQTKRSESSRETEQCAQGDDKRYSDLCAQWKAADAAADSAWWAEWGAWISGVSGLLVLVAIGLAFQANWIARDTAKRHLRAYISFDSGVISPIKVGEIVCITFSFRNAGQTPAYLTAEAVGIGFSELPITTIPNINPQPKDAPSLEGPGSCFTHKIETSRAMTAQEIAAYNAGERAFVGSCDVRYRDIFGKDWHTMVSVYRSAERRLVAGQVSVLSFGNSAT